MRITQYQSQIFKELAKKHFGHQTTVCLFGSRTDDLKKGGDIDLFIKNNDKTKLTIANKVQFLADLKTKIGDQKIDVVFDNSNTHRKTNFYHSVFKNKLEL